MYNTKRPTKRVQPELDRVVQPTDRPVYMGVGEVRKNFKALMEGDKIVVVGTRWMPRALLIPLATQNRWDRTRRSEKIEHMEAAVKEAFALVGD
jgi:hypothetical protein